MSKANIVSSTKTRLARIRHTVYKHLRGTNNPIGWDNYDWTEARDIDDYISVEDDSELVKRLMSSFSATKQHSIPEVYQPSGAWRDLIRNEWQHYYEAIRQDDWPLVAAFLHDFFRNEAISGIWDGTQVFKKFSQLNGDEQIARASVMRDRYQIWKKMSPHDSLKQLDAPRVGNPWGYRVEGNLIHELAFEYNLEARRLVELLYELESPVVVEIGGGFGGLAYQLFSLWPHIKYIGFDLPENILIQSYYLSNIFPEKVAAGEIVLLPNFKLPQLPPLFADLVINVHSLSEMEYPTIREYLFQIDRIGRRYFYHENLCGKRPVGLHGIPSGDFPALKNFDLIKASESVWPEYKKGMPYPCQANLFVRRDMS